MKYTYFPNTAVPSILCVMFQAGISFVLNLLNIFLVWFPKFTLNLMFGWLQLLQVYSYFSCSTFVTSVYINSCILVSSLLPLALHCIYCQFLRSKFYFYNSFTSLVLSCQFHTFCFSLDVFKFQPMISTSFSSQLHGNCPGIFFPCHLFLSSVLHHPLIVLFLTVILSWGF